MNDAMSAEAMHPRTARALMDSILRLAKDEARRGKYPQKRFDAVYLAADIAGIPSNLYEGRIREVIGAYRDVLQSAETQKIDVRELIGESYPVTA